MQAAPHTQIRAQSATPDSPANPFASPSAGFTQQQDQQMQQRFLQHFESMRFQTAIEPDHAEWLEVPTHRHTFRFNVCERVAQKMRSESPNDLVGRRAQDVWLGTQVDRGRMILQRLGIEIIGKPRVERDELHPDRIALEYDVDMLEKNGPVKPHEALPQIAKALSDATSQYYTLRKAALNEGVEQYIEPGAAR